MPPRGRSIADFGAVAEHGNGWRARLQLDGKKSDGPQRATRAEAQEDLHGARQRNSRLEMKLYLLSLGKQAGEHVASEASGVAKSAEARGDADEAHASDEIAPNLQQPVVMPDIVRLWQSSNTIRLPGAMCS